jgi:arsenate reductase
MKTQKLRVIFLCCHNAVSSQMAEAFLRHYSGDKFEVFSAGLKPVEIHPLTVQVMKEIGIDLSGQQPEPLRKYWGKMRFDYLITVCSKAEQECFIFPGVSNRLYWPLEDPTLCDEPVTENIEKFRTVRDLVDERVRSWLVQILERPQNSSVVSIEDKFRPSATK